MTSRTDEPPDVALVPDAASDEPAPQAEDQLRPRLHRVRDGDTLRSLAVRYLGNTARFREIYEANLDRLSDPDLLPIGVPLRIPPRAPHLAATSESSEPASRMVPVTREAEADESPLRFRSTSGSRR